MALSALDDKTITPTDDDLRNVLGDSMALWESIKAYVTETYPPIHEDWNFPGQKYGWSLRLVHKKRRVLYLIPQQCFFLIAFVFGDRAIAELEASTLPAPLVEMFTSARKYAEGQGARIEIRTKEDVEHVKLLTDIKMAN